jgi:hypothetical protein
MQSIKKTREELYKEYCKMEHFYFEKYDRLKSENSLRLFYKLNKLDESVIVLVDKEGEITFFNHRHKLKIEIEGLLYKGASKSFPKTKSKSDEYNFEMAKLEAIVIVCDKIREIIDLHTGDKEKVYLV